VNAYCSGEDEDPAPHSPIFEGPVGFGRLGEGEGFAQSQSTCSAAVSLVFSTLAMTFSDFRRVLMPLFAVLASETSLLVLAGAVGLSGRRRCRRSHHPRRGEFTRGYHGTC